MESDDRARPEFRFTEATLTRLLQKAMKVSQQGTAKFYAAVCSSLHHPDEDIWIGEKREDRREALRDAVLHNKKYNHHAGVVGRFNLSDD